ncbi:MAG: hypothetical protein VBE63_13020 [Lamprobacter sp.]|uniref:TadE/TadG family type IV pilus assembly protein n=1 Tax=Lamprobacter sp. TaxID=3100796 RepID=UPI002B256ACE|nr:hypothetical protein [Lamprobacter sp.]MEA3640850.1 hypothetical protein [Lamprobacter sp.]
MISHRRSSFSAPQHRRSQAGAAIVETLIFIPTIFIMTFLTIEVTNIMRVNEKMSWVAENSVRQGSEGMSDGYRYPGIDTSKTADIKLIQLGLMFNNLDFMSVIQNTYTEYCSPNDNNNYCDDDSNWEGGPGTNPTSNFTEGDLVRVTVAGEYKPFLGITERLFPDLMIKKTFTRVISRPLAPDL